MRVSKPVRLALFSVASLAVLYLLAVALFRTQSFHRFLLRQTTQTLEELTGARVELADLRFHPHSLQLTLFGLVLHGRESPSVAPLFAAREAVLVVNPLTLVRRRFVLFRFDLDQAEFHVRRYPDGSTNVPAPAWRASRVSGELLDLSVSSLTMSHTSFFWDDRVIPLDLTARDVALVLHRVPVQRYSGSIACSDLTLNNQDWPLPPVKAAARLDFSTNDLELSGVEWQVLDDGTQAGTVGQGSLVLRRLPAFQVEASVRAEGGIPVLARLLDVRQLRAGNFIVTASATYSKGSVRSRGHIQLHDLQVNSPPFRPQYMSLVTDYSADGERVLLPNLRASLLGGEIQGRGEVSLARQAREFTLHTEVHSISIRDALEMLPPGQVLNRDLAASSSVQGTVAASWGGRPQRFSAQFDLSLSPPARVTTGLRRLAGGARGTVSWEARKGALVTFDAAHFQLPHSSLTARGTLSPLQSNVSVQAESSDFQEERLLFQELLEPPMEIPLNLRSRATFDGSVSGPWSGPLVRGKLTLGAFDLRGWKWDGFQGMVVASPTLAEISSGRLIARGSTVAFDIWTALESGKIVRGSRFHVSAQTRGTSLEALMGSMNIGLPVSGRVNGAVDVQGALPSLAGSGTFDIAPGTLWEEPFDRLAVRFRLTNSAWNLQSIELKKGKGRASGHAWVNVAKNSFGADMHAGGFELSSFKHLRPTSYSTSRLALAERVAGQLSFDVLGKGTLDDPDIKAALTLHSVSVNDIPADNVTVQLGWHGREVQLKGDALPVTTGAHVGSGAGNETTLAGRRLQFSGTGVTSGDWPFRFQVSYTNFHVDPWIDLFRGQPLSAALIVSGSMDLAGPLKHLDRFEMHGQASELQVEIPEVTWKSDRPIALTYSNHRLTAGQFRLRGPSTDIQVACSIDFLAPAKLNFRAQGHGDANVLAIFVPGIEAIGSFDLNLRGAGTLSRPDIRGTLDINNVGVAYGGLPFRFAGLTGEIQLTGDRATISSLRGGGGPTAIAFSGYAMLSGSPRYDLQVDLEQARIGFPTDFTSVLTGNLRLAGDLRGGRITGDLAVTQMFVTEDFNLLAWMGDVSMQASKPPSGISSPIASNVRLNVHISSQPQVRVESHNLQAVADIDLNMRGTLADPVGFGSVHVESGTAVIRGDVYRLTRGDITMNNPVRTQMNVDLEARTRVQDYELTLDVTGPAERTRISYRSDPPLPTEDILSLLALGYTRQSQGLTGAANANRPFGNIGASALLSQAFSSQTSSRLQRLFGVSRIKIDPNVSGPLASGGPRVTIEEQMARDFSVTYSQNTSGVQQRVIQINWDLSDRVSLIGDRDQNGVFGVELRFRSRFK